MAEMSRLFNFDDFDQQIAEALEQNEAAMSKVVPLRRPGEIGAVLTRFALDASPSLLPDPPEAA